MIKRAAILGFGCVLASCAKPSNAGHDDTPVISEGKAVVASAVSERAVILQDPVATSNGDFSESFEAVSEAGGMVLNVDASIFDDSGFMSLASAGDVILFEDPSCSECSDIKPLLAEQGIGFVLAPVAFYSENGLDLVAANICEAKELESSSEGCANLIRGMTANTGTLMVQGIVDVPSIMLPNGWLIEGVSKKSDIARLRSNGDVD